MLTIDGVTTGQTVTGTATWEFHGRRRSTPISAPGSPAAPGAPPNGSTSARKRSTSRIRSSWMAVRSRLTVSHPATAVYCDWYLFPG